MRCSFKTARAADERARASKRFAASVNHRQELRNNLGVGGDSTSARPVNRSRMRLIKDKRCSIFFSQLGHPLQRSDVAIHTEDRFSHNNFTPRRACLLTQRILQNLQIKMWIDDFSGAGESHPIDKAGVIESV